MNGIMPGPLWLAIASATIDASPENRNLIQDVKNDSVTRRMIEMQFDIAGSEQKRVLDDSAEPYPTARSRERQGG